MPRGAVALWLCWALGCATATPDGGDTITIARGRFTMGSSLHARAEALDEVVRHGGDARDAAARLADERPSATRTIDTYAIMAHPVTQADYAAYVYVSGAPEPWVDARTWSRTPHRAGEDPQRVAWHAGRPQRRRMDHPAVLVRHDEAASYCAWWGEHRGGHGALPTEAQWERAARGDDGRAYPWGSRFVARRGNTRESGYGDTVAVATQGGSASPHGVRDVAGNVAEWTREVADGVAVVKGAAWSDDLIAARPAARRTLATAFRHVAVGFRCVLEPTVRAGANRRG